MPDYKSLLKNVGLNDSEIAVYLTALERGASQAHELVDHAGFSRPATYLAIEQLMQKGLLSSVMHGKRNVYSAESPEQLLRYGKTRIHDMESKLKEVGEQIDGLKLIQHGEKPIVKYYEGAEGLRAILQDLVDSKPTFTEEITNLDIVRKVFSSTELESVQTPLEKFKTPGRALFAGEVKYVRDGVEARLLPKEGFDFLGDILLYGDKIALVSFDEKIMGVVIQSRVLAQTYHTVFELAWRGAKNFPPR